MRTRTLAAGLLLALAACHDEAPSVAAPPADQADQAASGADADAGARGRGARKRSKAIEAPMADVIAPELHAGDGSLRMAARLRELASRVDPSKDGYANSRRVEYLRGKVAEAQARGGDGMVTAQVVLGTELLLSGRNEEALAVMGEVQKLLDAEGGRINPDFRHQFLSLLALTWLRVGETSNCIEHHGAESCIVPISEGGRHDDPAGSTKAMELLGQVLEAHPDDFAARWLYNIAAQTVGDWPEKVPAEWLVPPTAFASEQDIGHFPNIAAEVGIKDRGHAGGVCEEDFDGDGLLDLLISDWVLDGPLVYFHNDGDGGFTDRAKEAGLAGLDGGLNLIHADYDNDGDADVLVLRGAWRAEYGVRYPPSLLQNDGKGHFRDVTEEAGLLCFLSTQTAAWADYDGDGWLDVFFGNESVGPHRFPCRLFRSKGDGTFEQVSEQAGVDFVGYVKGVSWGDYDDDGRPDLYVSRMDGLERLYHNKGDGTFEDVAEKVGAPGTPFSFPTWWFDYDNDGHLDIFVSGYKMGQTDDICRDYLGLEHEGHIPRLYRNRGDGSFEDKTLAAGLGHVYATMGCNWGDLDNDGWPDFYLATGEPDLKGIYPNRLLRNDGGKRFVDITTSAGFGSIQKGHGVAFGDLDNDGDQDVFTVIGGAFEGDVFQRALFENPGHPGTHWVTLKLVGVKANRAAIGARIRVNVRRPDGSARDIWTLVGTGGSFGSETLQAEMGLGDAVAIEQVEIRWPGSGTRQVLAGLPMERFWQITEGSDAPVELKRTPYKLGRQ